MNALILSGSTSVSQTGKYKDFQKESRGASETGAFSTLLENVSAEKPDNTQKQQNALIEKLEEALGTLQELPQEELSPEQQELLYALVELLAGQKTQLKRTHSSEEAGSSKSLPIAEGPQTANVPVNEKLVALIQKFAGILEENASVSKQFEQSAQNMGGGEKNFSATQEKISQVAEKLLELAGKLEKLQDPTAAKPVVFQAIERLQPVVSPAPAGKEDAAKAVDEAQKNAELKAEGVKAPLVQAAAPILTDGEGSATQANAGQPEQTDPVLQTENKQPPAAENIKANQAAPVQKAEAAQPVPTVRMANLTEELGEIFRSSMRMAATPEGTQIRVNITPDHLGHLDIRLTETNGKIAAQIFTSSLMAKEALDQQVSQLRNTLIQQGISVEKIEVTQQSSQQQSLNQQQANPEQRFAQQQRQGSAASGRNAYMRGEEEVVAERAPLSAGQMKVDYTV